MSTSRPPVADASTLLDARALIDAIADAVAVRVAAKLHAEQRQPDEWLTAAEVASLVKLSKARLEAMRRDGTGPKFGRTGRRVRYRRRDVDSWLENRPARGR